MNGNVKIDTAMVMSAGLGTRMRPLTDNRPKPLVELAGGALIDHVLTALHQGDVKNIVVNVHYLADQMEEHLSGWDDQFNIKISDERHALMETGGGLVKAQHMLQGDPFFCLNSDNLWVSKDKNIFQEMAQLWRGDVMDALLLLVPHENAHNHIGRGDFNWDGQNLTRRGDDDYAPYIFSGIQIISHNLLKNAPNGPFSTNILWDKAMEDGRVHAHIFNGQWFDIGRPEAIAQTEEYLRENKIEMPAFAHLKKDSVNG
ncbi:hypothetical protein LPB140_08160 [Sphingorhabdus lutea]|uniref:Nucleotidyl transferase domain-containing protein n=1 Tax=Sphingorhabdus lutea TaxID=1913578 RepID=A0A1L3JCA4_9SPHN|nr:nucleotidyltransferase family protein [Sphingorhabdus lutea]APG62765.1 hypothetical protein LPB140_08160 [Sphingorhabdus lutea]